MTPTPLQQTLCNGLLYGLKIVRPDNRTVLEVEGIDWYSKSIVFMENGEPTYGDMEKNKPVLFPLDMLDKEIEINGDRFVPMNRMRMLADYEDVIDYWEEDRYEKFTTRRWPQELFQLAEKWHLNVHKVPEDQFIPANDNFNPYK